VTYYYVQQQGTPQYAPPRGQRGYGTVNQATPNQQFPAGRQSGFVQPQQAAAGPSGEEVPPSYQQAVQGDNKVQGP